MIGFVHGHTRNADEVYVTPIQNLAQPEELAITGRSVMGSCIFTYVAVAGLGDATPSCCGQGPNRREEESKSLEVSGRSARGSSWIRNTCQASITVSIFSVLLRLQRDDISVLF